METSLLFTSVEVILNGEVNEAEIKTSSGPATLESSEKEAVASITTGFPKPSLTLNFP